MTVALAVVVVVVMGLRSVVEEEEEEEREGRVGKGTFPSLLLLVLTGPLGLNDGLNDTPFPRCTP